MKILQNDTIRRIVVRAGFVRNDIEDYIFTADLFLA